MRETGFLILLVPTAVVAPPVATPVRPIAVISTVVSVRTVITIRAIAISVWIAIVAVRPIPVTVVAVARPNGDAYAGTAPPPPTGRSLGGQYRDRSNGNAADKVHQLGH